MIDLGKRNVAGVLVDAVDYEAAVERVRAAARAPQALGVTALAVHGVVEATRDAALRARINELDLVTADGQPVRWALNLLHRAGLAERVYGPTLMLRVCEVAAREGLPVYLYGSRSETLALLAERLRARHPALTIAGTAPSRFGRVSPAEMDQIAGTIRASGARIVFAGLGCPRQEVFAYELRDRVGMPVLAVGAAFDYHAGLLREPPTWVQRRGLQWAWRMLAEPGRLWRRYLTTNPRYVALVAAQWLRLWRPDTRTPPPAGEIGHA